MHAYIYTIHTHTHTKTSSSLFFACLDLASSNTKIAVLSTRIVKNYLCRKSK